MVGALLRMAKIDIDSDGRLSEKAYARFQSEGENVMDMLQNVTLNWTILLSLFLTIYVSLAIMHSGEPAYAAHSKVVAFGTDDELPSAYAPWTDFASYAWPDDAHAQAKLRRSFYIGECITIGLGLFFCATGLMNVLIVYSVFGAAFPDIQSKVEFMHNYPAPMFYLWGSFDGAVLVLPPALAFVTARSSALMSLTVFSMCGAFGLFMASVSCRSGGIVGGMHLGQAREARRILQRLAADNVAPNACPPPPFLGNGDSRVHPFGP